MAPEEGNGDRWTEDLFFYSGVANCHLAGIETRVLSLIQNTGEQFLNLSIRGVEIY